MFTSPRGIRLGIGIFGRRNVGKSSLLNAITRQSVSIVSSQAGTTTDPVEKPMELLPLGPVLFIDTAGIDDEGALGELRIKKTRTILDRVDLGIIVFDGESFGGFEIGLFEELKIRNVPAIFVFNKTDQGEPPQTAIEFAKANNTRLILTSATSEYGVSGLRQAILDSVPDDFVNNPSIAGDLVGPGGLAVLVVPIDKEAPKGRIILPQVQTIRDLLDHNAVAVVAKETELKQTLKRFTTKPDIVITDSQAFLKVAADTPDDVPMTSFSILFSRHKGDLLTQVQGALAIDRLKDGDRVLIAEACSHHPIDEDIGTVKIPKWLTKYVGANLEFKNTQGHDFPEDLSPYKLVILCGGCMFGRRETLNRILHCKRQNVPVTNYGLTIAFSLGIFERALRPFPSAHKVYNEYLENKGR
ncbi:MAG TPA: [FeFe] hydrogenase H-cluster maturation GTPase HydF [Caldisericia bacterium]|nr:[FeFe] hydrogenase H-cluster maturation GTPase HydF [Caldisericia bacterium]